MRKLLIFITILFLLPIANAQIFAEVAVKDDEISQEFNDIFFNKWLNNESIIYVMMPIQNDFANEWMKKYNASYPSIYFDGGYRIVKNSNEINNAIQDCMERNKILKVETKAEWLACPCVRGLDIVTKIKNNGNNTYEGILRVYVVEINSRWKNDGGERYHFSFLEFADVKNVELKPGEEITTSVIWDTKHHYPDIYTNGKNNVAAIAVVFNRKTGYVDGVASSLPSNISPYISIVYPKNDHVYIFGREIFKAWKTIIIGGINVRIEAWDDHGIKKIELYKDGEFAGLLDKNEFRWDERGAHSIDVIAYDDIQSSSDHMEALIL